MTTQAGQISSVLFERGTLVDLYIGRWSGNKKLRPTDVMLEQVNQDAIKLGHKKLLPKEAMDKLAGIERKARATLDAYSIPFPVSGAKFVFFNGLEKLLKELDELKKEWLAAVDELLKEYPQLKEKQLVVLDAEAQKLFNEKRDAVMLAYENNYAKQQEELKKLEEWLNDQRRQNRLLYPLVDDLKARFPFEWHIFDIAPPRQLGAVEQRDLLAAQNQIQQDLQQWVTETTTAIHQQLGEAAQRAKEALEANGRLTPRNLRPLFDAFQSFSSIDFTQGSETLRTIEDLRRQFATQLPNGEVDMELTAHSMSDAKEKMNELLSTMANLAVEETAASAARNALLANQTYGRFVDL